MEIFNSYNSLNFGNLVEIEPKILIASRDYADQEFFNRNLKEYIDGFSDGQSNFWIGLNILNKVTSVNDYKLRVVATNQDDTDFVEEYLYFRVGNYTENFKLIVKYLALGSNSYFSNNNGAEFSTYDKGPKKLLAYQNSGGYWHTDSNSYCFTCVHKNYPS